MLQYCTHKECQGYKYILQLTAFATYVCIIYTSLKTSGTTVQYKWFIEMNNFYVVYSKQKLSISHS